jgi:hypothetical protein
MKLTLKSIFGIITMFECVELFIDKSKSLAVVVKSWTVAEYAKVAKLFVSGVFFLLGNIHAIYGFRHIPQLIIEPVIRFYADVNMLRDGLHLRYNNRTNLLFVKGFREVL